MPQDGLGKLKKKFDIGPGLRVPSVEVPHKPEETAEAAEAEVGKVVDERATEDQVGATKAVPAKPVGKPSKRVEAAPKIKKDDPTYEAVEDILEEDLGDIYFKMDPKHQQEFKIKGEETAGSITRMVKATQATMKKVLGLIRGWLKVIPGINRFFLEQEAKIKTDEVMKLEEEMEKKQGKV